MKCCNALLNFIFGRGPDTTLCQAFHRGLVGWQQLDLPVGEELPRVQEVDLLVVVFVFLGGANEHLMHPLYDAFEL